VTLPAFGAPAQPCGFDATAASNAVQFLPSSKANPCPVCGRTKDGDCRTSTDGRQVICHKEKDYAPGTVVNGWAFTKNTSDGRAGHFIPDKPRNGSSQKVVFLRPVGASAPPKIILARLDSAKKEPPAHWPNGMEITYGEDQWVKVVVEASGDKKHIPHHRAANGETVAKQGPNPWPLWSESMAINHGPGKWIVEAEGEKCAAWFHAASIVAVSQPGHAHTPQKIQDRYDRLVAAGVAGVVYLADHDKTGAEKAEKCKKAAAAAGLPFITVQAASVWPAIPAGGSIDDASGTAAERVAAMEAHLQQLKPEQSAPRPTSAPGSLPANFQDLIQGLPDGWRRTKDGVAPSRISVGQMAQLIEGKKGELLRFNEMKLLVEAHTTNGWQPVNDAEMDSGYVLLDQKGWIIGLESVIKALCHVARQRSIHPVREYLLRIEQEQSIKPYDLDRVGPDMFRAVLPLHAAMLRKWLVGAVARALEPGCQMDFALVLHSPKQGIRKTSSFNELASPDWFNSTVPDGDKDFLLNVHSCWIFELAELESVTGQRAAGRLKNLITTRRDLVRVPYGRTPEHRKRSGVFCGTVNTDSFLRDDTGDRRFWVVPIEGDEKLDVQGVRQHRDSIWKAAVLAHRAGELPMLTDEQEGESEQQNERFKVHDAWLEMLQLWMAGAPLARVNDDDPTPRRYQEDGMYSSAEIIYSAGLKRPDQIGRGDETRVGPLLKSLGFTASRVVVGSSKLRRWVMDQPRTNRTNLDQPKNLEVGPWESVAGEGVSGNGPTGPTKNSKLGKKDKRQEAGEQAGGKRRESFKEEVGPDGPPAETTSVCNGSAWTNPPSAEVGPGRSKVGPGPVFDQNWPVWLPDLLAIRTANPGQPPSIYANDLMAKHQVPTDGRTVKALLNNWDATHSPAA
jgi:hypothetical protein